MNIRDCVRKCGKRKKERNMKGEIFKGSERKRETKETEGNDKRKEQKIRNFRNK
jgi:hypothetical protein